MGTSLFLSLMPRLARLAPAGMPLHIMQRGNNKQPCFWDDQDRAVYIQRLLSALNEHSVALHAYVLMDNHIHLLATANCNKGIGGMMKQLSQRYVQYVNKRYDRSGGLWEGRYKSCLIQSDSYLLNCYRYIELNPVRAGLVVKPADYVWSSYKQNAEGVTNRLITAHSSYLALNQCPNQRLTSYRNFVEQGLSSDSTEKITNCLEKEQAYGTNAFINWAEKKFNRTLTAKARGRPPQQTNK